MRTSWLIVAAAGMMAFGLTGCRKEETAPAVEAAGAAVEQAVEQPAPAVPADAPTPPAQQVPKDHPAH